MYRFLILLVFCSCMRTEVLNAPEVIIDTASVHKKPPKPPTPPKDTSRVLIGFNPSVGDWEEEDIDL